MYCIQIDYHRVEVQAQTITVRLGGAKLICMLPFHDFVARGRARAFDRGLIFNCELMIFDRGLILE